MKFTSKKRGFTIIELVIVIAVVAILAAVLIPVFSNLVQQGKDADAKVVVRNLNTGLKMETSKPQTMHDALAAVEKNVGINVAKLNETYTKTGNQIVWDSEYNTFLYIKADGSKVSAPDVTTFTSDNTKLWAVANSEADLAGKYSYYWNGGDKDNIVIKTSFDVGKGTIGAIVYSRADGDDGQTVSITTNGGKLTINAEKDTVNHYGTYDELVIDAVAPDSYHEFGTANGSVTIKKGHFVVENGASVPTVSVADDAENSSVKISINNKQKVYVLGDAQKYISETTELITSVASKSAVAYMNGNGYSSLKEAYDAAKNNDEITLLANHTTERINLEDKSIKLNLNGKTLTSSSAYKVVFCPKNGNTISVDGTVDGSKIVGTIMCTEKTTGNIKVDGGTYESDAYCPFYVNGANSETCNLEIKNAVIYGNNTGDEDGAHGIYLAGLNNTTIENCTIQGLDTGLEIRAGSLNLINCIVKGNTDSAHEEGNGNGTTMIGVAVGVAQHTTKYEIIVNIKGGIYTAKYAVLMKDVQNNGLSNVTVTIQGGTFNGMVKNDCSNWTLNK